VLKHFTITLILLASFGLTISQVSATVDWNLDMLGFSSDSKFFILVESITEAGSGIARARIMIIDVASNKCVRGGCVSASGSKKNPRTEKAVLRKVYRKTWKLRRRLRLTPPKLGYKTSGPILYEQCKTVYVYQNQKIHVRMRQNIRPKKASVQLEVSIGDTTKTLDSLNNYRNYVQKYNLSRLFLSPNKKSIAILIRIFYREPEGEFEIRTLVQTVKLF
jgi:predicted secreted protein